MHRREIKYKNFDGEEVSGFFYFHFSVPELTMMEMEEEGSLSKLLQRIIDDQDGNNIVRMVERFILDSFGIKSIDGETFIKIDDDGRAVKNKFRQSAAYEALFVDLTTDAGRCGDFVNAVMPAEMIKIAEQKAKEARETAKAMVPESVEATIEQMGGTQPGASVAPWSLPADGTQVIPPPGPTPPPPPTGGLGVIVPQAPPAPQR